MAGLVYLCGVCFGSAEQFPRIVADGLKQTDIGYEQFKWLLKAFFVWALR